MNTDRLQRLIQATAPMLTAAEVWPNGLGIDTVGADGRIYTVTVDERDRGPGIRWIAATDGGYACGSHPWAALASISTED